MEEQNKNQSTENQQQINKQAPIPPQKNKSGLMFILFLVIALLAVVTWLYIDQRQTTDAIETALTEEKDSLQSHLLQLRDSYDELMTDNDSLNAHLVDEKEKIDVPFIMFTGRGREETVTLAFRLGAIAYITKETNIRSKYRELYKAVKSIIGTINI